MKCSYCNQHTNTYQKYHENIGYVSPLCIYHQNFRTDKFTVPDHIPNQQHQLYLWTKHDQFTNGTDLEKLMMGLNL